MDLERLKAELATRGELRLKVKVVPKASRSEIAGAFAGEEVKIRVQAPPERGKANAELKTLLAREFGVGVRQVEILAGENSSRKQVRISTG